MIETCFSGDIVEYGSIVVSFYFDFQGGMLKTSYIFFSGCPLIRNFYPLSVYNEKYILANINQDQIKILK